MTAIWEYDKRRVNRADFVYHGMRLRSAAGAVGAALVQVSGSVFYSSGVTVLSVIDGDCVAVQYASEVVAALGLVQGPSHMEVIMTPGGGPCLVEVSESVSQ